MHPCDRFRLPGRCLGLLLLLALSNGPLQAQERVKNINTVGLGAGPGDFVEAGGQLFFTADDPATTGRELWVSDGTEAGTHLVKDIRPGLFGANPTGLTAIGDRLFFIADDGLTGRELWMSDGTEAGTILVRDLNAAGDGNLFELTGFRDTLYFVADDGVSG